MSLYRTAAESTFLSEQDIRRIVKTAPRRYKVFTIKKRSGGDRIIAQPSRELKDIQIILIKEVLSRFPIHDCSRAYRKDTSILDNASPHRGADPILKMDLEDFFPSIKAPDFAKLCESRNIVLSSEDMEFCLQVLFWQPKGMRSLQLSIGAPSSPMLSNAMMYEIDSMLDNLCSEKNIKFTRYADDLTFSAPKVSSLVWLKDRIPSILERVKFPRLRVNNQKTSLITPSRRRTVTGLVLTNDGRITIGRDRKRIIRAKIDHLLKGDLSSDEANELFGWLAFLKSIEPKAHALLTARLMKK